MQNGYFIVTNGPGQSKIPLVRPARTHSKQNLCCPSKEGLDLWLPIEREVITQITCSFSQAYLNRYLAGMLSYRKCCVPAQI